MKNRKLKNPRCLPEYEVPLIEKAPNNTFYSK